MSKLPANCSKLKVQWNISCEQMNIHSSQTSDFSTHGTTKGCNIGTFKQFVKLNDLTVVIEIIVLRCVDVIIDRDSMCRCDKFDHWYNLYCLIHDQLAIIFVHDQWMGKKQKKVFRNPQIYLTIINAIGLFKISCHLYGELPRWSHASVWVVSRSTWELIDEQFDDQIPKHLDHKKNQSHKDFLIRSGKKELVLIG